MKNRWVYIVVVILSLVGFIDASYLTYSHYADVGEVSCGLTGGCSTVLTSDFATITGIPLALIGAAYYIVIFMLAGLFIANHNKLLPKLLKVFSGIGVIFSAFLIHVQAVILESWCQYCLLSAVITTVVFILSLIGYIASKKDTSLDL